MKPLVNKNESGPIYGIQLIDSLPLGVGDNPLLQAMPGREELKKVQEISSRTVGGFEVLLHHYRQLLAERERLIELVNEKQEAGQDAGFENSGNDRPGEVFSLWRIDTLNAECVGSSKYRSSYAWATSSHKARELFQHYYSNRPIDRIEEVFSGEPRQFLTQLDSDGTLRPLNVFVFPPQ